jgi:glucosyl-3-phosphoglycerate synthase
VTARPAAAGAAVPRAVSEWVRRHTSAAADWPADEVRAAKGSTTVAVVLPALDEEETVGGIVAEIRRRFVAEGGGDGLVDELVVLDSGSGDRTGARAAAAGARVVHRDDVVPEVPAVAGKGEALWRSLAATTADVVVFVDADLRSFVPAYVTGLVGPLLAEPSLQLVKAAYERPVGADGVGGGRVTELVARPLLTLWWPELAGVAQPLGGEYAARRSLLERLPFPTGYGVELALLLDTWAAEGADAVGQVVLPQRLHRHHDDARLGLMAAELLQVALARLPGAAGRGTPATFVRASLAPAAGHGDAGDAGDALVRLQAYDVTAHQRPPMVTVPGYHRARTVAPPAATTDPVPTPG